MAEPLNANLESVDCPACGPSVAMIWLNDGKPTRYMRCKECGTIYASPRESWEKRYSWLDQFCGLGEGSLANSLSRQGALLQAATTIKSLLKGGRMLDIGCNLGDFFHWFSRPEWACYGAEISPSAAEYSSQKYGAQVFPGTIHQASYPDHFFDLVTIMDTFYYIDDPQKELIEIARILKPNGLLAIEIPGLRHQVIRGRGIICWLMDNRWTRFRSDSAFLYWYSQSGLEKLLSRTGFEIFGWRILQGSSRSGWIQSVITAYYCLIRHPVGRWPALLDWAPKYLCLAQAARPISSVNGRSGEQKNAGRVLHNRFDPGLGDWAARYSPRSSGRCTQGTALDHAIESTNQDLSHGCNLEDAWSSQQE
jgi:SAM-dependent methyltransferase